MKAPKGSSLIRSTATIEGPSANYNQGLHLSSGACSLFALIIATPALACSVIHVICVHTHTQLILVELQAACPALSPALAAS